MIYNAAYSHGSERLLFVVNPGHEFSELQFADGMLDGFNQVADSERWGDPHLSTPHFRMHRSRVTVPPLSCGLFVDQR
jgi:hypothetical protein